MMPKHTEPTGTRFNEKRYGEMILADDKNGSWSGWLFYKNPGDGSWVSLRYASPEDVAAVEELAKFRLQQRLDIEQEVAVEYKRHLAATNEAFVKHVGLVDLLMQSVGPLVDRDSFGQAFDPVQVQGCMNAIEAHYVEMQANPLVTLNPRR